MLQQLLLFMKTPPLSVHTLYKHFEVTQFVQPSRQRPFIKAKGEMELKISITTYNTTMQWNGMALSYT